MPLKSSCVTEKLTGFKELSVKLKVTIGEVPEKPLPAPAKPAARKIPELKAVVSKITTSPAAVFPMSLIVDAATVATVGSHRISTVKVEYPELTTGVSVVAKVQTVLMVWDAAPDEVRVGETLSMVYFRTVTVKRTLIRQWRRWNSTPTTGYQ